MATLFFTMIVPDNSEVVKAGREEGAAYRWMVTDAEDKSKSFGPPHVLICTANIAKMKTRSFQDKENYKEHHDKIEELHAALTAADEQEVCEIVPYQRINRTYDEAWRVRFQFRDPAYQRSVSWYLEQEGGEKKGGRAPRGKSVRKCQKWLK